MSSIHTTQQLIPEEVVFSRRVLILPWLGDPDAQAAIYYDSSKRKEWINSGDSFAAYCRMIPYSTLGEIWFEITRRHKSVDILSPVSGLLLRIPQGTSFPHIGSFDNMDRVRDHSVSILLPEGETPLLNAREWFNDCMALKNKVARWSQKLKQIPRDRWPNDEYEYADIESYDYLPSLEAVREKWKDHPQDVKKFPAISTEAYLHIAGKLESRGDESEADMDKHCDYKWAEEWYNKALTNEPTNTRAQEGVTRTTRKQKQESCY